MKIHEYQAKSILRRYGVPLLNGEPATTPDEAVAAAERIGGTLWVVKSQIPRRRPRKRAVQGASVRRRDREGGPR